MCEERERKRETDERVYAREEATCGAAFAFSRHRCHTLNSSSGCELEELVLAVLPPSSRSVATPGQKPLPLSMPFCSLKNTGIIASVIRDTGSKTQFEAAGDY
ncbi:hypothetical protein AAHE18_15G152000 [Arachis hypogaea]|nr:uncharacterized protein DS421_15g505150 [Arachis hypogaea]